MSRLLAVISLVVALSGAGCKPQDIGTKTNWQELQLTGKTLELISLSSIETYHFYNDGFVDATFGKKEGSVTGPTLYWKIENNNLLISEDSKFKDTETISPPYLNKNIITINRNFIIWERFKISHD